jgi:hypothetical protein
MKTPLALDARDERTGLRNQSYHQRRETVCHRAFFLQVRRREKDLLEGAWGGMARLDDGFTKAFYLDIWGQIWLYIGSNYKEVMLLCTAKR